VRLLVFTGAFMFATLAHAANPWPPSTVPTFMTSCTRLNRDLVPHCQCIITDLMREVPFEEFQRLSQAGSIANDARYLRIRNGCLATPRAR